MIHTICVVGLGYVGLPLAVKLSKNYSVCGFDIQIKKIEDLKRGFDETGEVGDIASCKINFSYDPHIISEADVVIIAVPTPIDENRLPDLLPLKSASEIVGKNMKKNAIVVYESTVYPGCTEEYCLPILEKNSGFKYLQDFKIGYSPERINPGDRVHTIDKITKVVSGCDMETLEILSEMYGSFTTVHRATSIKVAEAAKVIENVQRSLNIALMNELALIFDKIGISTKDVLDAASTKWNFHRYTPGLVGGHCIGIDPYYLTYKAKQLGYDSKVILAGQEVNEYMTTLVASKFEYAKNILVLGATFKENVPDTRNSKAFELVNIFVKKGVFVTVVDPLISNDEHAKKYGYTFKTSLPEENDQKFDGIILFSPHDEFKHGAYQLDNLKKICTENALLFDVKGVHSSEEAERFGFIYKTL